MAKSSLPSPSSPWLLDPTSPRLVREHAALDHVEAVAGAQNVQDRAADGDRAVPLDAVDVGFNIRAVDNGHAVAAQHLHRVIGEEGGRILVDADAEQSRTARHQGQETADAIALAEMLVDDHARYEIEPCCHLRHAHARRGTTGAVGDHVGREDRGAGTGASNYNTVLVPLLDLPR